MILTLATPPATSLMIWFTASGRLDSDGAAEVRLRIDGQLLDGESIETQIATGAPFVLAISRFATGLAAMAHTIRIEVQTVDTPFVIRSVTAPQSFHAELTAQVVSS